MHDMADLKVLPEDIGMGESHKKSWRLSDEHVSVWMRRTDQSVLVRLRGSRWRRSPAKTQQSRLPNIHEGGNFISNGNKSKESVIVTSVVISRHLVHLHEVLY